MIIRMRVIREKGPSKGDVDDVDVYHINSSNSSKTMIGHVVIVFRIVSIAIAQRKRAFLSTGVRHQHFHHTAVQQQCIQDSRQQHCCCGITPVMYTAVPVRYAVLV